MPIAHELCCPRRADMTHAASGPAAAIALRDHGPLTSEKVQVEV